MGNLDTALGSDAAVMCADFGEPWVYTPQPIAGAAQPSININPIVDRHQPQAAQEGPFRVQKVTMFIRNSAAGLGGIPSRPEEGDSLNGPWQLGQPAQPFRVTAIVSQDPGGWTLHAETSLS